MSPALLTIVLALGCTAKVTYDTGSGSDDTGPSGFDMDDDGFYTPTDCDDEDPAVNPAAAEICDDRDNDCDGSTDEGLKETYYIDADRDGFGDPGSVVEVCEYSEGLAENPDDCDDSNAEINPDATEFCNGEDDDCDEETDEDDAADAPTWYQDIDGDLYGDDDVTTVSCEPPDRYVDQGGDCADDDADRNPGVEEVCNGLDDDCDEVTDEDEAVDAPTWYRDVDGDDYGVSETSVVRCYEPDGYAIDSGDCDDRNADLNPGAEEICDGIDNDCDEVSTEEGLVTLIGEDGSVADVSAYFTSGTPTSPEFWSLSGDSAFYFCQGTYYTLLSLDGDVSVIGVHGSSETTLSAANFGSVLSVTDNGVDAVVSGLTLQDGDGDGLVFGSRDYMGGGGLYCAATADVTMDDIVISDVSADVGGGIYVEGCEVWLGDSEIYGATADFGAATAVTDGVISISTSHLHDNSATNSGGAVYADGSGGTTVAANVLYSLVEENDATYGGGAAVFEAAMGCIGDTDTEAGFLDNTASYGGATFNYQTTTFRSTECDWGTDSSDNQPEDIFIELLSGSTDSFDYGDDESFSCNGASCN